MLWSADDCLRHVAILHRDNVGPSLLSGDGAGAALESAVWHAHLLGAVDDDGDSVALLVVVKNTTDEEAAALGLAATQNRAGSLTGTMTSAHP